MVSYLYVDYKQYSTSLQPVHKCKIFKFKLQSGLFFLDTNLPKYNHVMLLKNNECTVLSVNKKRMYA